MFNLLKKIFTKKAKDKISLLESINLGSTIAEQDQKLEQYFLETQIWKYIEKDENASYTPGVEFPLLTSFEINEVDSSR